MGSRGVFPCVGPTAAGECRDGSGGMRIAASRGRLLESLDDNVAERGEGRGVARLAPLGWIAARAPRHLRRGPIFKWTDIFRRSVPTHRPLVAEGKGKAAWPFRLPTRRVD